MSTFCLTAWSSEPHLQGRDERQSSRWSLIVLVQAQIVYKHRQRRERYHLVTRSLDRNPELPAGLSSRTLPTLSQRPWGGGRGVCGGDGGCGGRGGGGGGGQKCKCVQTVLILGQVLILADFAIISGIFKLFSCSCFWGKNCSGAKLSALLVLVALIRFG